VLFKTKIIGCIVLMFGFLYTSCKEEKRIINFPYTDLSKSHFIPKPLKVIPTHSGFPLDKFTAIHIGETTKDFKNLSGFLAEKITKQTGISPHLKANDSTESIIYINASNDFNLKHPEAYHLKVLKDSIILTSNTATGAFRGIQTLRQLIPNKANDTLAKNDIWVIPSGEITDTPQFEYRGTMLDVARHFFSVEDIKKYIDVLSYYKINVLHLHLSDDQGWRIEIKSWPKLTEIGSITQVGGTKGGFYTQKDYTEIVNYATLHYITIVPEIDMPGHTNAASLSYPILNGNGKAVKPYTGMRVGFSTFDTRKDTVYTFINDVVRELAALTPGPYFHIGGDESHVTKKEDYNYFVNKVEAIVQKHGKRMIGWDETANAGVDSTSIAQIWHSEKNMKTAIKKGMKLILSPAKNAYLDMKYDALSKFGLDWAGFVPVNVAYNWYPETMAPKANILGIEAPLWSETIGTLSELEYLAFPRIIGHAEIGWSLKKHRNWEDYKTRLAHQYSFLNRNGVNYYASPLVNWMKDDF